MDDERDWNAEVIAEFRASRGEVVAPYPDPPPMLLLHTIGARTGREHVVPMRGQPDGDGRLVVASAHGRDRHPDWCRDVVAQPEFEVEVGAGAGDRAGRGGAGRGLCPPRGPVPHPAEYQLRLPRTSPVIRLERRGKA
jgi:deazaflavin-dependent oxidoreductase (nitroreductase family)